jgi:hypothetical protein
MRHAILFAALSAAAIFYPQGSAQAGYHAALFCYENDSYPDCAYDTLQQCLRTASGAGGRCFENPRIAWAQINRDPAVAPHARSVRNCTVYLGHGRWTHCR